MAALRERVAIVAEIRAMADEVRNTWDPNLGRAIGTIIDDVADKINTYRYLHEAR